MVLDITLVIIVSAINMYIVQEEELTRPIHFAAQRGKCDVVRGLVTEYGVDPTSKAMVSY